MSKDSSKNSKEISMNVADYVCKVMDIGERLGMTKLEIFNGVTSGILTAVYRYTNCPKCAGEVVKESCENLIKSTDHSNHKKKDRVIGPLH